MKALTVRQPWAGCIAHLSKRVENRTWRCPDQFIGTQIAIHAAAAVDDAIISVPNGEEWASLFAGNAEWDAWRHWFLGRKPRDTGNWPPKLTLSAVVGVATIAGCHRRAPGGDGECGDGSYAMGVICSPWAMPDQWHWELADVRALPGPVPCKGKLGLWNLPEDAEAAVTAQLEMSTDA